MRKHIQNTDQARCVCVHCTALHVHSYCIIFCTIFGWFSIFAHWLSCALRSIVYAHTRQNSAQLSKVQTVEISFPLSISLFFSASSSRWHTVLWCGCGVYGCLWLNELFAYKQLLPSSSSSSTICRRKYSNWYYPSMWKAIKIWNIMLQWKSFQYSICNNYKKSNIVQGQKRELLKRKVDARTLKYTNL